MLLLRQLKDTPQFSCGQGYVHRPPREGAYPVISGVESIALAAQASVTLSTIDLGRVPLTNFRSFFTTKGTLNCGS